MENQEFSKSALDKFRQWHFWWLVVFSFLLIITFVYYLPTWFLQKNAVITNHHEEEIEDEHGHGMGGEAMMDEEMHEHMDQHMSGGMDMDEMTEHMEGEHMMTEEEMHSMMDEMMGHEHEDGTDDHGHEASLEGTGDEHADEFTDGVTHHEEGDVKEGLVVNLNISPVPYNVGVPLNFDFFVNTKPGNVPVLASQLQMEHTKLMHVVGLRSDMNEFFHIHPEFLADNPSIFSIEHTFKKPGLYKIWSDVKKDGKIHLYGHPEINVNGVGSREEKNVSFERNVVAGPRYAEGSGEASNYQVSLVASDTIVSGREVDLTFDIHTLNGQEIGVEDYLGAKMHLVLIKDDWSQFVHTHPANGNHGHTQSNIISVALANGDDDHTDEVINFVVTFPEPGLYKAFAQFRPEGIDLPADEAITAEFWIDVKEKPSFPISQWWSLLFISAILMAGLSWAVNKYLKVKPEDVVVKR